MRSRRRCVREERKRLALRPGRSLDEIATIAGDCRSIWHYRPTAPDRLPCNFQRAHRGSRRNEYGAVVIRPAPIAASAPLPRSMAEPVVVSREHRHATQCGDISTRRKAAHRIALNLPHICRRIDTASRTSPSRRANSSAGQGPKLPNGSAPLARQTRPRYQPSTRSVSRRTGNANPTR